MAGTTVKAEEITVNGTDRAALVSAIDQAAAGDVILIPQSIAIGGDQLTISKNVTFRGVGDNIEITAAEGYTSRILQIQPPIEEGKKLVFEKLTFIGANNQGNSDGGEKDGGMGRIGSGNVEFVNSKLIDNASADRGGAFDIYGGNVTFIDTEVSGNHAPRGGAIVVRGGTTVVTFQNCKITDNYVTGDRGGAFWLESTVTLNIYNSVVSGNYAGNPESFGGSGGAVFASVNNPTLNVVSSSIVNNKLYGDHGGVIHTMGGDAVPVLTFINTTIANNRMFTDSNSLFFIDTSADITFVNVTMAGNYGQPNAGNTTGIGISKSGTSIKIYNSIIAGNTANNGSAVDLKFDGGIDDKTVEIKNSIVGYIRGLNEEQIATITGIETSTVNEYVETQNWRDTETSGITWDIVSGNYNTTPPLTLQEDNDQKYAALQAEGDAIGLGNPTLLAAATGNPLKDQLAQRRYLTNGGIAAGSYEPAKKSDLSYILDTEGRSDAEGSASYDVETHTITYNGEGEWKWYGWEFPEDERLDLSEYATLTIEFDSSDVPTGGTIEFEAQYADGTPKTMVGVQAGASSITLTLHETAKSAISLIFVKSQKFGENVKIKLNKLYASALPPNPITELPLDDLNLTWGDISYNSDNHVITYTGGNKEWDGGIGWEFDQTQDYGDYYALIVEFEEMVSSFNIHAEYGDDSHGNHEAYLDINDNADATSIVLTLGQDKFATKKFYMQFKGDGQSESLDVLKLKRAYIVKYLPDLIATDVSWLPENPQPGEAVTFSAKVKNIGLAPSPAGIKHGAVFQINSNTVTWCDAFLGPLAVGEEYEISATMEGSSGGTWECGKDPQYTVRVFLNDTNDFEEISRDNNYSVEKTLTVDGKANLTITDITWTPSSPETGDNVTFKAAVKNIGTVNTPKNVVHLVQFYVNNVLVSWSDSRLDPINVDTQVRLTANAGPDEGDGTWTATPGSFIVKAVVNDSNAFEESDYENNSFEIDLTIAGIHNSFTEGKVYVEKDKLRITGYPSTASVTVYNVLAQKVASYHSISTNMNINVPAGTYIVQIQNNGKTVSHKVLIK
jgi:hypothetical protein